MVFKRKTKNTFTNVIASPVRAKQSIFGRLVFALVFACIFIACSDESSSSAPAPDPADGSSSSVAPTSNDEEQSSSSQKSSGKEKSSSSVKSGDDSQKSSSSVNYKNSSSFEDESSSSEGCSYSGRNEDGSLDFAGVCCDGDTAIVMGKSRLTYYTCKMNYWMLDSIAGQDTIKPYVPHPNMEKQFASNIDYETFVDERDGQEYKIVTITIDNGLAKTRTFFAENLNLGKQIMTNATEFSDSVVEKVCYNDDEWYCDNGFGGLYTWSEAMNIPKKYDTVAVEKLDTTYFDNGEYINQYIQGICPKGWHIMTEDEWRLIGGGGRVNSRAVWGGYDLYGFSLLPVGVAIEGGFYSYGEFAYMWLPELCKERDDWGKASRLSKQGIVWDSGSERYNYLSLRCTKDY